MVLFVAICSAMLLSALVGVASACCLPDAVQISVTSLQHCALRMATGVLCAAVSRRAAVGCCCCRCSSDKRVYHVREYVSLGVDERRCACAGVFLRVFVFMLREWRDTQANMTTTTTMARIIVLRVRGIAYIAWRFHECHNTVLAS